jgi:hypothetical protein
MPRPFVNLDDVEFSDIEDNGYYASRRAQFSAGIGAPQARLQPDRAAARQGAVPFSLPACEYPDSNKVVIGAREPGTPRLWRMFRAETNVDYYDRESIESPERGA